GGGARGRGDGRRLGCEACGRAGEAFVGSATDPQGSDRSPQIGTDPALLDWSEDRPAPAQRPGRPWASGGAGLRMVKPSLEGRLARVDDLTSAGPSQCPVPVLPGANSR